jgi:hypothetical protein
MGTLFDHGSVLMGVWPILSIGERTVRRSWRDLSGAHARGLFAVVFRVLGV